MILIPLLTIAFLLLCSGFFSGSETALTAVSRAKIHKLTMEGNKRAAIVEKIRHDKDKLIGALLLGNNAVNILASAIATDLAIKLTGEQGIFFATLCMTLLVLIFSELLPKSYAFHNSEKFALIVAAPLSLVITLLSPITFAIQKIVSGLMRLLSIHKSSEAMSASDALRGAIELHHRDGDMIKSDKDMLGSILDMAQLDIEEVMIHRKNITSLDINKKTDILIKEALESPYSRIPLWEDRPDNIIAILHVKALLRHLHAQHYDSAKIDIKAIASQPWFVPETTTLNKQLTHFREKKKHLALVINEYSDLVGLITLEDILEEIVGQIEDEHDRPSLAIRKRKDGGYLIKADTSLRDINRDLDWNLPDETASTLAGFVLELAEDLPEIGDRFTYEGLTLTVQKKKKNQITTVLIHDKSE